MESNIPKIFNKSIDIVYISTPNYLLPLSISLNSLIKNCSDTYNYDIIILCYGINENDEYIIYDDLESILKNKKNISVRLYDPSLELTYFFKKEEIYNNPIGYYRRMFPEILFDYNKIVNLGADTIINYDIAGLYMLDLNGKSIGSVFIDDSRLEKSDENNKLVIDTDVMVLDLDIIRKRYKENKIIGDLKQKKLSFINERHEFTEIFENDICCIDSLWNVRPETIKENSDIYEMLVNNAKIFHYCGKVKPWINPLMPYAEKWWKYARESSHYEAILRLLCYQEVDNRSFIKRFIDYCLPKGTRRREFVKNILLIRN